MTPEQERDIKEKICCLDFAEQAAIINNRKETAFYFKGIREGMIHILTGQTTEQFDEIFKETRLLLDMDKSVIVLEEAITKGEKLIYI